MDDRNFETVLGLWTPYLGFRISDIGFRTLCQWTLESGLQSLVGFRIA